MRSNEVDKEGNKQAHSSIAKCISYGKMHMKVTFASLPVALLHSKKFSCYHYFPTQKTNQIVNEIKPKKREKDSFKWSWKAYATKPKKNTKNEAQKLPKKAPKWSQKWIEQLNFSLYGQDWLLKAQNELKKSPKWTPNGSKMESTGL